MAAVDPPLSILDPYSTQCPICLDDCDLSTASKPRRAVVVTHCSHVFHMGCIAEHYARDASMRCPICRSDLADSELVSPAGALPQDMDIDALMRHESLRSQVVALISACVNQALKRNRRWTCLLGLCGIAGTCVFFRQRETHEQEIRELKLELSRVDAVNLDLRRRMVSPLSALFRRLFAA